MIKKGRNLFSIALLFIAFTGCVSVKEYQKVYLNDKEMELADRPVEVSEISFETYREGAAGGNGGKTGGGCGCN